MRKFLLLFLMTGAAMAQSATTTTYTGILTDLSQQPITSGQVTFTLTPSTDSTLPGTGRFIPSTINCNINIDGTFSGFVAGVVSGPCMVTRNTAISPGGTAYRICIQANYSTPGSCWYDYATTATKDISTPVPTLSTGPTNYGGVQGPPLDFQGTWSASTTYGSGQVVSYNNQVYISLGVGNLNNIPSSSPSNWSIVMEPASLTAAPTVDQTVTQPGGTFFGFTNPNPNATTPATAGVNVAGLQGHIGHVCVEDYLSTLDGQGGVDYGYAIRAAVQAQSLTTPTQVAICDPGQHPIYSQAVFDRPIHFNMEGSKLIPQATMGSTPVITTATATAGSKVLLVPGIAGMAVNQAIGGLGITFNSYITAMSSSSMTLSLPPSLVVNGFITAGSTNVPTSGSLAGFAVGQGVSGYGIPSGETITAITYTEPQSITLSEAPTQTVRAPVAISVSSGTWAVPTLTAVKVTPVIVWGWNAGGLQNEFGQMIGGSMSNVWINDTSIRGIQGLQGVQIYGWDGFNAYNTRIEQINGSGLILGGNVPSSVGGEEGDVRESYFFDTKIRYSGSDQSNQSALSIFSPFQSGSAAFDEINQIGFNGGQIVTNVGENITIGTYDPAHTGTEGPRLLFFGNNFQVEGGNYHIVPNTPESTSQFDSIHLVQAGDVYFNHAEINSAGYAKGLLRIDQAATVTVTDSRIIAKAAADIYTVGLTHGSTAVTFVSSNTPPDQFLADGSWDGIAGLTVDGTACTTSVPCVVHLAPVNGVPSQTTMTLSAPYQGTTNASATITLPTPPFVVNQVGSTPPILTVTGSEIDIADLNSLKTLGILAQPQAAYVGGMPNPPGSQDIPSTSGGALNYLTVTNANSAAVVPIATQIAPLLNVNSSVQSFFGQELSANNTLIESFNFVGPGSSSNTASWALYGSTNAMSFDTNGQFKAPTITATSGFNFNGTPGITHNVTLPCGLLVFQGGILTSVTGSC